MNMSTVSDYELLALLVGKRKAKNYVNAPLSEVFGLRRTRCHSVVGETIHQYEVDERIGAAKELVTRCLAEEMQQVDALNSPASVRDFLRLNLAALEHEMFCIVFLDTQHRVIAVEELFRGTLSQASVYPREVVKRALAHNAAALILAHNHPSGVPEPSMADQGLTTALKSALALVDVRVLDHFVITVNQVFSFAERGIL
jgi:DNA repair protein RadC